MSATSNGVSGAYLQANMCSVAVTLAPDPPKKDLYLFHTCVCIQCLQQADLLSGTGSCFDDGNALIKLWLTVHSLCEHAATDVHYGST